MKSLMPLVVVLIVLFSCRDKAIEEKEQQNSELSKLTKVQSGQTDDPVKFPVYDFEGFESLLYKDDGKTYVVNFWATWCKPCIEEMPYFERINKEQRDNNVEVVLVSLDMPSMWKSRLEPYVEKKGIQSKIVILDDPKQNEWIPKVDKDWGGGIPATLIYNQNQRIFYERGFTYEELNSELNKFLN